MKNFNIPTDADGVLFAVSTSHMDWDWIASFDQYYGSGAGTSSSGTVSVRYILDQALSLIHSKIGYQYNLAEIAWLQRYMLDKPAIQPTVAMAGRLFFLGGGITSPDNLVCNGEAFIRNYLLGRAYVKSLGLGDMIENVCWIPDDFGQDPQLPVVLTAMGISSATFWRVPGLEPTPPSSYTPIDGSLPLSTQLANNGVTFNWEAADGSIILAQQMADGYGIIWNQAEDVAKASQSLDDFVKKSLLYPGNLYMAPCGGDFSQPSENLLTAIDDYNTNKYPKQQTKIYAVLASYQDYVDALNEYISQSPGNALQTIKNFNASNFWTGHFSSRVQLKINQQRAVNLLMAAETLSTLLHVNSYYSGSLLTGLDNAIASTWENLVPSTHHDYVNGTSSNAIYYSEQLPLSDIALDQAGASVRQAMSMLGGAIRLNAVDGDYQFVVFNPSGFKRSSTDGSSCVIGNLVEIEKSKIPEGIRSYRNSSSGELLPVQTLANGNILLPYDGLDSTGYGCVYLSTNPAGSLTATNEQDAVAAALPSSFTFSNGVIQITVNQGDAWAISSMVDVATGYQQLMPGHLCNQLLVYYEKGVASNPYLGNLYQMGNELYPTYTDGSGFYSDNSSFFEGGYGVVNEIGPYRWHFTGKVHNTANNLDITVEYFLDYNEPIVRVKVTGNAANQNASGSANTVVSLSSLTNEDGTRPIGMKYGTANHWTDGDITPYWHGPTFHSTHDYVLPTSTNAQKSATMITIYHEAMRAWALNDGFLNGIVFRNAPGTNRGANGTDVDVHTQRYAFRLPDGGTPESCKPLMEAIAFQQPLLAAPVVSTNSAMNTMGQTGFLAEMQETNAIIRVARTQRGSAGAAINEGPANVPLPFSFVLRIYQPTNSTTDNWNVNLPFLSNINSSYPSTVSMVTALEEELTVANEPYIYNRNMVAITGMPTLATLRVQTVGLKPLV